MQTKLNVAGMTCDNCVKHITKALEEVPGVRDATVSLESHTAIVEHDDQTILEALIEAVEEEGYKAGVA